MLSYQSVLLGSWGFERQHYFLPYLGVSWQLLILLSVIFELLGLAVLLETWNPEVLVCLGLLSME